jgi:hypoxanthine-DNA glycosylase
VLGSFPGTASLDAGQYYAYPRNHFWPIVAAVLGRPLVELSYGERLRALLSVGVGLWDVIVECERSGSLDGAIRAPQWADPAEALRAAPRLARVCFNGQTATKAAFRWQAAGLATLGLPSTSPAYTRPMAEKLAAWRAIGHQLHGSTRETR